MKRFSQFLDITGMFSCHIEKLSKYFSVSVAAISRRNGPVSMQQGEQEGGDRCAEGGGRSGDGVAGSDR